MDTRKNSKNDKVEKEELNSQYQSDPTSDASESTSQSESSSEESSSESYSSSSGQAEVNSGYNFAYNPESSEESSEEQEPEQSEFDKQFKWVNGISSGVTGVTAIYRYHGSDPSVLPLLNDRGELVVKSLPEKPDRHSRITFGNEVDNINSMLHSLNEMEGRFFPKTAAVKLGDRQCILVEGIYCDEENKESQTITAHMMEMGKNAEYSGLSVSQQTEAIGAVFNGMLAAQSQLHSLGLLHLDSGTRNFMLGQNNTVRVIDFGASLPMDENGKASRKIVFPKIPVTLYDQGALAPVRDDKVYSIQTDVFGLRMAMMECLGCYLGIQEGTPMNKAIHLKSLNIRDDGNPICISINRTKDVDMDKLREISEANNNRPILVRQDGMVKIYGNKYPELEHQNDWALTDLGKSADSRFNKLKFSSNQLQLVFMERKPTIDDMTLLSKTQPWRPPFLVKSWDIPNDCAQYFLYRYSVDNKKWVLEEVKPGDLRDYIKENFDKEIDIEKNFDENSDGAYKFPAKYNWSPDWRPADDEPTYKPDVQAIVNDDEKLDGFRRLIKQEFGNLFKHQNVFKPKDKPDAPDSILLPSNKISNEIKDDLKSYHCVQNEAEILVKISDSHRLALSFDNLKAYAKTHDNDVSKIVVLDTLAQYEVYLKAMPMTVAKANEYSQADARLFNQCHMSTKSHLDQWVVDNQPFSTSRMGQSYTDKCAKFKSHLLKVFNNDLGAARRYVEGLNKDDLNGREEQRLNMFLKAMGPAIEKSKTSIPLQRPEPSQLAERLIEKANALLENPSLDESVKGQIDKDIEVFKVVKSGDSKKKYPEGCLTKDFKEAAERIRGLAQSEAAAKKEVVSERRGPK